MARRACCRRVGFVPTVRYFKPQGIPLSDLEEIALSVDELEAIRLADMEGLYHNQAADEMSVSRQTFGRVIEAARKKVAQALVEGKALKVEGGEYAVIETRKFNCHDCRHDWEMPYGVGRPAECPECRSANIHRAEDDRGCAQRRTGGPGGGACRRLGARGTA